MSLQAQIIQHFGHFEVDAAFAAEPGEVLAVIGPNGAGKTRTLDALAGLRPLDGGAITLDGQVLDRPDAGIWVSPERRRVGVVFQDLRLFGHLSALDNVAYGLRRQGLDRRRARAQAAEWLERLEVAHRAGAKPAKLSGGEAQRVALARALAIRPRLLLLDEPLSALDMEAKGPIRALLARHLADFDGVAVIVTHDLSDVLHLADQVVILEGGRTVNVCHPAELVTTPACPFAAAMAGLNLLAGECSGGAFRVRDQLAIPFPRGFEGPATAALHPNDIEVYPLGSSQPQPQDGRVSWVTTIEDMTVAARAAQVTLGPPLPLIAQIDTELVLKDQLRIGSRVRASVDPTKLTVRAAGPGLPQPQPGGGH